MKIAKTVNKKVLKLKRDQNIRIIAWFQHEKTQKTTNNWRRETLLSMSQTKV